MSGQFSVPYSGVLIHIGTCINFSLVIPLTRLMFESIRLVRDIQTSSLNFSAGSLLTILPVEYAYGYTYIFLFYMIKFRALKILTLG